MSGLDLARPVEHRIGFRKAAKRAVGHGRFGKKSRITRIELERFLVQADRFIPFALAAFHIGHELERFDFARTLSARALQRLERTGKIAQHAIAIQAFGKSDLAQLGLERLRTIERLFRESGACLGPFNFGVDHGVGDREARPGGSEFWVELHGASEMRNRVVQHLRRTGERVPECDAAQVRLIRGRIIGRLRGDGALLARR